MNKNKKVLITISVITALLIGGGAVWASKVKENDLRMVEENKKIMAETLPKYTLEEVAMHNSASDCWSSIDGFVYDMTQFINLHPGGEKAVAETCGIDGTAAYNGAHHGSARKIAEVQKYIVGVLK